MVTSISKKIHVIVGGVTTLIIVLVSAGFVLTKSEANDVQLSQIFTDEEVAQLLHGDDCVE